MKVDLKIQGLSCSHCTNAVENLLKVIDGVESTIVRLPDNAEILFNEHKVTLDSLKKIINNSEIYKVI